MNGNPARDGTDVTAFVGRPMDRVDGQLKVRGEARYAADTPVGGVLHAVLVGSAIARGRIVAIDESRARAIAGVVEIVTHRNALRLDSVPFSMADTPNIEPELPPLQSDQIMYWGQHIAVVIAETGEAARAGADALRVTYDRGAAVVDIEAVRADALDSPSIFGDNLQYRRGDPDVAFQGGRYTVDATYATPVETHHPIEPHATIAEWHGDDELLLHDSTQWVYGTRNLLATFFHLEPAQVRVRSPFVGGGFGCKGWGWGHPVLAAMAAKIVGRPVKVMLTREQMASTVGHRTETEQRLRLAASADGRLVATLHDTLGATSRVGLFVERAGIITPFLYSCPNVAISHQNVVLDINTPTAMRAPGEAPGTYALESAIDELAFACGLDPLDFRLRNYAERDEEKDTPFSSKALREAYRRGAERFGWHGRPLAPRSMRAGDELIGWGMATATYPAYRSAATARVTVGEDGHASVVSATHDLGTGTYTILTQVAADALGMSPAAIAVRIGDSALPKAPVAGGSMSAASVTPAVHAAAAAVRREAIAIATGSGGSPFYGCAAGDIDVRNGRLCLRSDPSRSMSYADVMRVCGVEALEAERTTAGADDDGVTFQSFGAHFCEVRFDEELARLRVTRFVSAMDCGRILNAKTARSQIIGGVTMGIGMALMEQTVRDPRYGSILNDNLADYHVPVNADIGEQDVIFVEEPDLRLNPLGVRGIGEIGITGVAAAVAGAVFHATGLRVRRLPIVAEKLLPARYSPAVSV